MKVTVIKQIILYVHSTHAFRQYGAATENNRDKELQLREDEETFCSTIYVRTDYIAAKPSLLLAPYTK